MPVRDRLSVAIHFDQADRTSTSGTSASATSSASPRARRARPPLPRSGPGARPAPTPTSPASPFRGFGNRLGEWSALEYPTYGLGDYRVPAITVEQPDGSTVLDLAYASHRILPGKPADRRPAGDVRRGGRRGGDPRDHPPRRAERHRGAPVLHDLPRRARDRPERPGPQHRQGPPAPADGHERRRSTCRPRLGARPPERHLGSRAPRRRPAGSAPGGYRSAASAGRPAPSTTRSSSCAARPRPSPPARRSA